MHRPALGPTQPPIQWVPVFLPRVKRLGREVNYSPSSSAEVKNGWSYASLALICIHGVGKENFTVPFKTVEAW
jgi:hypothetical protein